MPGTVVHFMSVAFVRTLVPVSGNSKPRARGVFLKRQTRIRLDDHYLTLAPELEIDQGFIGTAQHLVRFLAGGIKGENTAKAG